jgi:glutaryl-CoA dehydrogenase
MLMYESVDYYQLTNLFSEEEKLVQKTARRFVEEKFIPIITAYHRKGEFPLEMVKQLGELGFLGPTIPEKYGGAGLNNMCYGLIMQELERGDSGLRSFASVQGGLVIYPIYTFGSEKQKTTWLPLLISGEKIGCFGLTESDHGSNPAGMKTTAQKISGGYRITGSKMWITNGSLADIAIVWAKLDNTIRGFLIEKGTPGFQANTIKGKFSLRETEG